MHRKRTRRRRKRGRKMKTKKSRGKGGRKEERYGKKITSADGFRTREKRKK